MAENATREVGKAQYGGLFTAEPGPALPFALPGERVESTAAGLTILQPSPDRVEPGCVHFGTCGGCQYQHIGYPAQLAIKRGILHDLLQALGPLPAPAVHSAEPWGYRNRIRLRVRHTGEAVEVGYSRRGTNEFLPIRMCPIAAPLLWRAAEALLSLAASPSGERWLLATAEVELFCTPSLDRLQAQFLLRETGANLTEASFAELCLHFQQLVPELSGTGAALHPDAPRRARLGWAGAAWGKAGLLYPAAGREYWVSRGAFFQVNRFLVDTLVALATGRRTGRRAWDLYAGAGLFTRALADRFAEVVAVEGSPAAAADLLRLHRAQPAIDARQQATLDFLRGAIAQRERPDLVVLDPPRAGLGPEGAELLVRVAPERIVYVSCDPTTLARDLLVLLRGGYTVDTLDLVDLFPQTFHLETVVSLRRSATAVV